MRQAQRFGHQKLLEVRVIVSMDFRLARLPDSFADLLHQAPLLQSLFAASQPIRLRHVFVQFRGSVQMLLRTLVRGDGLSGERLLPKQRLLNHILLRPLQQLRLVRLTAVGFHVGLVFRAQACDLLSDLLFRDQNPVDSQFHKKPLPRALTYAQGRAYHILECAMRIRAHGFRYSNMVR